MRFKEFACKYLYDNLLNNVKIYIDGTIKEENVKLYDVCADWYFGNLYVNKIRANSGGILEIDLTFEDEF